MGEVKIAARQVRLFHHLPVNRTSYARSADVGPLCLPFLKHGKFRTK